jgi:hypothetical protein
VTVETSQLDALVARLRSLPAAVRGTYPQMAEAIIDEIRQNIAAQRGPDGAPWPATQDGRAALSGAGAALSYEVRGTTIILTLTGIEARHHFGSVKGGRARPILPRSAASLAKARKRMDRIIAKRVRDTLKGAA